MKMNLTIVTLLFISAQGIAQSAEEIKTILKDNGIEADAYEMVERNGKSVKRPRFGYSGVSTSDGDLYISFTVNVKDMSDVRPSQVFLYTSKKQFSEVAMLNGYVVFGYSPKKNQLLVGKYNIRPDRSSSCQTFYTYDLERQNFTLQYDLEREKHTDQFGRVKYTNGYDSILVPNVRFGVDDYRNIIRKVK